MGFEERGLKINETYYLKIINFDGIIDYSLYDMKFQLIDGGQFNEDAFSFDDLIQDILSWSASEKSQLVEVDLDWLQENILKAEEIQQFEIQSKRLANKLVNFYQEYSEYRYKLSDKIIHEDLNFIKECIRSNNTKALKKSLEDIVSVQDLYSYEAACLLDELENFKISWKEQLNRVKKERSSVLQQLKKREKNHSKRKTEKKKEVEIE